MIYEDLQPYTEEEKAELKAQEDFYSREYSLQAPGAQITQNSPQQPVEQPAQQATQQPVQQELQQPVQQSQQNQQVQTPVDEGLGTDNTIRNITEGVLTVPAALGDFALGTASLIPGVDVRLPKFQNQYLQALRDIISDVAPTLLLAKAGSRAISSRTARIKWAQDPLVKWFGNTSLTTGAGAFVGNVIPASEDDNLSGTLKKHWPAFWSWLPDDIATLATDTPDIKRAKNVKETVGLGLGVDSLAALVAKMIAVGKVHKVLRFVPESEKAKNWIDQNVTEVTKPEDILARGAEKRAAAIDEEGVINLEKKNYC